MKFFDVLRWPLYLLIGLPRDISHKRLELSFELESSMDPAAFISTEVTFVGDSRTQQVTNWVQKEVTRAAGKNALGT